MDPILNPIIKNLNDQTIPVLQTLQNLRQKLCGCQYSFTQQSNQQLTLIRNDTKNKHPLRIQIGGNQNNPLLEALYSLFHSLGRMDDEAIGLDLNSMGDRFPEYANILDPIANLSFNGASTEEILIKMICALDTNANKSELFRQLSQKNDDSFLTINPNQERNTIQEEQDSPTYMFPNEKNQPQDKDNLELELGMLLSIEHALDEGYRKIFTLAKRYPLFEDMINNIAGLCFSKNDPLEIPINNIIQSINAP